MVRIGEDGGPLRDIPRNLTLRDRLWSQVRDVQAQVSPVWQPQRHAAVQQQAGVVSIMVEVVASPAVTVVI